MNNQIKLPFSDNISRITVHTEATCFKSGVTTSGGRNK